MNKERLPFIVLLVCGACFIALGASLVVPITDTLSPLPSKGDGKTIIPPNGIIGFNFNVTNLHRSGIGVFAFDFTSFRYYNVSDGRIELPGEHGQIVPWNGTVGFCFNVTNLDPNREAITLDSGCQMWSYFPSAPGQSVGPIWKITNVDPTSGEISPIYTPITCAFNVSTRLYFCYQPPESKWFSAQVNKQAVINLLLSGVFAGPTLPCTYAQNVPFISIYAKA